MAPFPQNDYEIFSQRKNLTMHHSNTDIYMLQPSTRFMTQWFISWSEEFQLMQSLSMHQCISLCSYNNESHPDATTVKYIFHPSLLHPVVHRFEIRSNRLSREYLPSAYRQETQSSAECCFSKSTCHDRLRNLTNI